MPRTDALRKRLLVAAVLSIITSPALAQDEPKPDQLRKMYDDSLQQLKRAQDRKNELATQVVDLQKQLDVAKRKLADADRDAAAFDQRTYDLRQQAAAWRAFLDQRPKVDAEWHVFLRAVDRAWELVPGLTDEP